MNLPLAKLRAAAENPDLRRAMRNFYEEVDRDIAAQPGTCWNKAACCRFGEFGHRLYVTALEVCYYLSEHSPPPVTADVCPHAMNGLCHARDHRPMGCRMFFCDPKAELWQGPLTEKHLARLKEMHTELDVPYFYGDWIGVLKAINSQGTAQPPDGPATQP